jgi:hypothetical protein
MLEIPITPPVMILLWPLKWVWIFFRYRRKIKFPKRKKYLIHDEGVTADIKSLPANIARYEIHIITDKKTVHKHIQSFNFGIGIEIPKGGKATLDLNVYLRKCFLDCSFEKKNKFHAQIFIYIVNGTKIVSPKYSYSV